MLAVLGGLMPGGEARLPGTRYRARARLARQRSPPGQALAQPRGPHSAGDPAHRHRHVAPRPRCARAGGAAAGPRATCRHRPPLCDDASGVVGSRRRSAERTPASALRRSPAPALPPAPRSFANSSGIFLGPRWGSDLARPGAALYGINPTPERPNPMHLPVRLRARVLAVRDVPPGTSVGYNATWRATAAKPHRHGRIGYADGWRRSLSAGGHALFDGTPVPLVGRVSMDLTTFDVTDGSRRGRGVLAGADGPVANARRPCRRGGHQRL